MTIVRTPVSLLTTSWSMIPVVTRTPEYSEYDGTFTSPTVLEDSSTYDSATHALRSRAMYRLLS